LAVASLRRREPVATFEAAVEVLLAVKYPAAAALKEADIPDPSFIDELERSGFIAGLYAGDAR